MANTLNRRRFLRASAAAAAALAGPLIVSPGRAALSDRVRLGFVGCGGRAAQTMPMFLSAAGAEIVAICDVIEPRIDDRLKQLAARRNPQKPDTYTDYRRLLDRTDVDAVVIATCQHQHALPFIHACRAGKAVYVEKPLSYDVREGRAMVRAAKQAGVVTMMGTQQRAGPHFQKAVKLIRGGRLGQVHLVECWNCHHSKGRTGKGPDRPEPPPGYHWNEWLGPAPAVPFNEARLRSNWWFDYSGGMLADWGVHLFDVALWAMNAEHPTAVSCTGGKFYVDDVADSPDTIEASWDFAGGWVLRYSYRGFNNYQPVPSRPHGHGLLFHGTKAAMVLDRFGYEVWDGADPQQAAEKVDAIPYFAEATPERGQQDGPWQRLFVSCVRGEATPPLELEESHRSTVLCHLGNVAYLTGRRIKWDGRAERVLGEPVYPTEAPMLDRTRRKGWELPQA